MPVEIPADKMADYLAMARHRHAREQAQMRAAPQVREALAWQLARRAAQLLKETFGAARVVIFGSLVQPGLFSLHSDVDLAAWGIQPEDTFRVIGAVYNLSSEIELNLRELLRQMSAEAPEIRPAVLSPETGRAVDEYLRFRHSVRNVYAFEFDPDRVWRLVKRVGDCHARARADLLAFSDYLENLARAG